ncbi:MAG: type II toxin-antitoxin system prevent-host-death family antitoxin [Actinomycetota bacterium]|nr:type II toxin-antitoxin system prevent-host-death family antitoxin [Actinomycetota bacterium]
MREIGVRELKQTLSETLRAVGRGELVRVTLRGRPLADLVPVGTTAIDDRLRQLIVNGQVVPPVRNRPARAPRLAKSSSHLASEVVLAERDVER